MSNSKIYYAPYFSTEPIVGGHAIVSANDYDAAQPELSALREELASRNEVIAMKAREVVEAQAAVSDWARKCKAAEQRNSALVDQLYAALNDLDDLGEKRDIKLCRELAAEIRETLKPTESGASE